MQFPENVCGWIGPDPVCVDCTDALIENWGQGPRYCFTDVLTVMLLTDVVSSNGLLRAWSVFYSGLPSGSAGDDRNGDVLCQQP